MNIEDGCIFAAGKALHAFPRAGNFEVGHLYHHDLSQCWVVRRSSAPGHDVRGFEPEHNRFSLCGKWLEGS